MVLNGNDNIPVIRQQRMNVTYQFSTTNKSFIDIYNYLRAKGIQNNKFHLALFDADLEGVNPRDPRLNETMKKKILRECMINYWYFIREVVMVPEAGGAVGGGARYKLHRGNLALNYGFIFNWNMFLELPRQHGKTISAVIRYLWCFLFGTMNSEMMFFNKKLDDSKLNLQRLKDIRESLPSYLQLISERSADGKKKKVSNSVESIKHSANNNIIKTVASARSKIAANSLGRGCTIPLLWFDEYAFIPFNSIIYLSASPAFSKASENAMKNRAPYGMLITTTPGDLLTDEGISANETRNNATPFEERFYDIHPNDMAVMFEYNKKSTFVYMRFTYKQLGSPESYFEKMCKELENKWDAIRREVLLEWAKTATNSPFDKVDLDAVKELLREPIRELPILPGYPSYKVYEDILLYKHPPIMGADVAGGLGLNRDSSSLTVIDSYTTRVIGEFNCNYISTVDFAEYIYKLVKFRLPNCIVNIEKNGGYGDSVLKLLLKRHDFKQNLFYEIKEKIIEERFDGIRAIKKKAIIKEYCTTNSGKVRELLMEILRERMKAHKDKFISNRLYEELSQLEVKKNGRIEHTSNGHDDMVFSYLMALYVWYYGTDLMTRYGITKASIKTDENFDGEEILYSGEEYAETKIDEYNSEMVQAQISALGTYKKSYSELDLQRMAQAEEELYQAMMNDPLFAETYARENNTSVQYIENGSVFDVHGLTPINLNGEPEYQRNELEQMFDKIKI